MAAGTGTRPRPLALLQLALLTVFLPACCALTSDDMTNGEIKTKDGSKCSWYELRKSGHNVTLGIGCHCRTERGSGQGYTCHYFGDPDDCKAYQENGKQFYLDIVQHIAEHWKSACDEETLSHDRCPDNVYKRLEHTPPEEPCFPHKKERYEL